jgi:hypothetical protein
MNEALFGSLIDKVDDQERKIEGLKEKVNQQPVAEEVLNQFKTRLEELRSAVRKISFPEKEMWELSARLDTSIELLKHPVEQKTIHHHYVPKVTWLAAGFFLLLCLLSMGWYNTYNKLDLYEANDTKYRYLKLEAGPGLLKRMTFIDSLCRANSEMREFVIAKEEQNQRDFEVMRKAEHMENGVKKLKKKVSKKAK